MSHDGWNSVEVVTHKETDHDNESCGSKHKQQQQQQQQQQKKAIRYAEARRKSSTCRFADRVARTSVDHYRQCIPASHRESLQATCVATILANVPLTDSSRLTVLAMGVGTKFLPESKLQILYGNGDYPLDRVRDCHAEVLARRAFRRYMTEEILLLEKMNDPDSHSDGILCKSRDSHNNTYQLKPGVTLHFYCSSSPCGNSVLKKFCKSKTENFRDDLDDSSWPTEPHPEFLGHSIAQGQCALLVKNDKTSIETHGRQIIDYLKMRIKPTPLQKTWPLYCSTEWCPPGTTTVWNGTGSLHTCSDKIARWNVLGWQGSLLSSMLESTKGGLYMETMTVGRKLSVPMCQRAVCCRVHSQTELCSKKPKQQKSQKQQQIFQVHHPSILATNVYLDETGVIEMEATKNVGADVRFHNPHCWVSWHQSNHKSNHYVVECIDGSTGYRITQDSSRDNIPFISLTSRISQVSSTALVESYLELFLSRNSAKQLTTISSPQSLTLLSELRHLKHRVAPMYEQAKTDLTTQHPVFCDWRRREYDIKNSTIGR
jgi:hypothetical protein